MSRLLTFAALLAVLACPARASTATLMGVDIYRSQKLQAEQLQENFVPLIRNYMQLRGERRPASDRRAEALKVRIEGLIREQGSFAYARMNYAEYFTSAQHSAYVTFDVVDPEDAAARMPFRSAPAGQSIDPEGLLEAWRQYAELGARLRNSGQLSFERPKCPAFHCVWGSGTPELEAFERRFSQFVPANRKLLLDVLGQEADPAKRARALYLLAYHPEGSEVASTAQMALKDPDEQVRAAALEIISDLAVYHRDVPLEVTKIIPVLDYPASSDRSRVMGVLVALVGDPAKREEVIKRGGAHLTRLLRLQQPSNHDLAFTLLGMLSQQSYDRRDYKSWDAWVAANAAPKPAKPKKKKLW